GLIGENLIAGSAQIAPDRRPERGVVVDDMDRRHHLDRPLSGGENGRLTEKAPPPLGRGSAQMRPRCSSTIVRAIERPTPIPCSLVVKNGSNTRASRSAGI